MNIIVFVTVTNPVPQNSAGCCMFVTGLNYTDAFESESWSLNAVNSTGIWEWIENICRSVHFTR